MQDGKVLFVDDELEVIKSLQRRFRNKFVVSIATSGAEGLEIIQNDGPFAVVVSDYRMPVMDGIEFLAKVCEITPDSLRIMLTGQPDLSVAIKAVNEGRVFRFLTKPCPPELLAASVEEGIKYYRLLQSERELNGLKKWRKSLEDLILAFAALVETRDPYTAGHQNNVTRLACAVAAQMGLEQDRIDGIRMAASIHDIGKMYVPAEFLNRPGRLSDPEFAIIKMHPQVGFDILKSIDFEYPIAQIVQQHHEALDGSGYPLGLRDSEILLEARIITVADVVEAMNSHRPYRPSLGLNMALNEIESNHAKKYDRDVVNACLKLIRSRKYIL